MTDDLDWTDDFDAPEAAAVLGRQIDDDIAATILSPPTCEACAGRAAEYEHASGCEHEWDYMRLSAAAIDAASDRERAQMWFSLWWRVCRPANQPLLPRWLARKAWRRVDRAESHWLRAGDRGVRT